MLSRFGLLYASRMSTQIQEIVASRVREARDSLGLTQAELAERIGLTWHTISQWERAKKFPSVPQIVQLAELSGRDPDWFLRPAVAKVSPEEALEVLHAYVRENRNERG